MGNSLVGKKYRFEWQSGIENPRTYEMDFISETEKKSVDVTSGDYESVDQYSAVEVAPNVYMISWCKPNEFSISIPMNMETQKIYGYYAEAAFGNALKGVISEV